MKLKSDFQIVKIVDDYMAVPVGELASAFSGTVMLNEVAAMILKNMKDDCTVAQLAQLLVDEYDVDFQTAMKDVQASIEKFEDIGLVE